MRGFYFHEWRINTHREDSKTVTLIRKKMASIKVTKEGCHLRDRGNGERLLLMIKDGT